MGRARQYVAYVSILFTTFFFLSLYTLMHLTYMFGIPHQELFWFLVLWSSSAFLFGMLWVEFTLHPSLLAVCFATGLVVIMAAAWLPAERAARLNLLIALQYE